MPRGSHHHPAPILLGFVLGPRMEENFRNTMVISNGSLEIFVARPLSLMFIAPCALLIAGQVYARIGSTRVVRSA